MNPMGTVMRIEMEHVSIPFQPGKSLLIGLLKKVLPPKKKRRRQMPDPFSQADLGLFLDAVAKLSSLL